MSRQTIGEFLQTLRKANGYTQQEVADKLGISNKTLSSWETDRATPDLFSLPALADLYGVTADEILRGERKAPDREENTEEKEPDPEKSERATLKNRYLRFNAQSFTLLIPSCAAALLLFTGVFCGGTVGIVLLVLGGVALLSAIILQVVFYKNALLGAELTEGNALSAEQKRFRRNVKNTRNGCLQINGIVYLCLGILLLLLTIIADLLHSSIRFSVLYFVVTFSAIAAGIAALVFVRTQKHTDGPTPIYTTRQYKIIQKNKKFFVKCVVGAVIPCVLLLAAACVLVFHTFMKTEEVYRGTQQQVTHHLQTLVVEADSLLCRTYGVSAAAYYFDLPSEEDREPGGTYEYYDVFEILYSADSDAFLIECCVEDENNGTRLFVNVSYANRMKVGDSYAYNIRYGATTDVSSEASGMANEAFYYTSPSYRVQLADEANDLYALEETSELYIDSGFVCALWAGLSAAAILVSAIVYVVKHEKPE